MLKNENQKAEEVPKTRRRIKTLKKNQKAKEVSKSWTYKPTETIQKYQKAKVFKDVRKAEEVPTIKLKKYQQLSWRSSTNN